MNVSNLPRLCFVHIPKTGGTTLNQILLSWYGAENTIDLQHWQHSNYSPTDFEQARFYHGHVHYHAWKQFLPEDTVYITLLRDPAQRAISHFHQIQRQASREIGSERAARLGAGLDISTYVRDPNTEITNMQVRLLAARYDVHAIDQLNAYILQEQWDTAQGRYPHYNEALQALKDFAVVGLTERFEDFVSRLAQYLGIDSIPAYQNQNVTPNKIVPSQGDLGHILRRTGHDHRLYWKVFERLYGEDPVGVQLYQPQRV